MVRATGHDRARVEAREAEEGVRFNLVASLDELAVTRLRINQALRREPGLEDLLKPGIEELDRVSGWLREALG